VCKIVKHAISILGNSHFTYPDGSGVGRVVNNSCAGQSILLTSPDRLFTVWHVATKYVTYWKCNDNIPRQLKHQ